MRVWTRKNSRLVVSLLMLAVIAIPVAGNRLKLVSPTSAGPVSYADSQIEIAFALREASFWTGDIGIEFSIRNLTNRDIEIDWNRSRIWMPDGRMSRLIHGGVRYIQADAYLPPSVIPARCTLTDFVLPSDSIQFTAIGWRVKPLNFELKSNITLHLALQGIHLRNAGYDFVFEVRQDSSRNAFSSSIVQWFIAGVALLYVGTML